MMLLMMKKAHVLKLKASVSCISQFNQDDWLFKTEEINVHSELCLSQLLCELFIVNDQFIMSKSSEFYLIDLSNLAHGAYIR